MSQHLWTEGVINAVESKYEDNPLYRVLYAVCLPLMNDMQTFALSPGELFYETLYILDDLRTADVKKGKSICKMAWDELERDIRKRTSGINEAEMRLMISLVLYAVASCLEWEQNAENTSLEGILTARIQEENAVDLQMLNKRFRSAEKLTDMDDLTEWLQGYRQGDMYLSDEIADLIDETEDKDDVPVAGEEGILRVKHGKKQNLMALLEAIFYAGYVERKDKGTLNRDEAIREMLRHGFGESGKHPAQDLERFHNGHDTSEVLEELQDAYDTKSKKRD